MALGLEMEPAQEEYLQTITAGRGEELTEVAEEGGKYRWMRNLVDVLATLPF